MDIDGLIAHLNRMVGPTRFGILVCGSASRDSFITPGDIDIVIVTDEPWVQKIKQRWMKTVLDIQIGPVRYYVQSIVRERQSGMIQMFVTGTAIADSHGLVAEVIHQAKVVLGQGPAQVPFEAFFARQRCATLIERARRYAVSSPIVAQVLVAEAIQLLMKISDAVDGRWTLAFQEDFRRLADSEPLCSMMQGLDLSNIGKAIASAEEMLASITGEPFEASMFGSTPRIRIDIGEGASGGVGRDGQ